MVWWNPFTWATQEGQQTFQNIITPVNPAPGTIGATISGNQRTSPQSANPSQTIAVPLSVVNKPAITEKSISSSTEQQYANISGGATQPSLSFTTRPPDTSTDFTSRINTIVSTPYAQSQINQGMIANTLIHDNQIAQIQTQVNAPIQKAQYAEKWFNALPFWQKAIVSVNTELVHFADRPAEIILGGFNPKNIEPFPTLAYDTQNQMRANAKQHGYFGGFGATLLQNQAFQITAGAEVFGAALGITSKIPTVGVSLSQGIGKVAVGYGIADIGYKSLTGNLRGALTESFVFGAATPFAAEGFASGRKIVTDTSVFLATPKISAYNRMAAEFQPQEIKSFAELESTLIKPSILEHNVAVSEIPKELQFSKTVSDTSTMYEKMFGVGTTPPTIKGDIIDVTKFNEPIIRSRSMDINLYNIDVAERTSISFEPPTAKLLSTFNKLFGSGEIATPELIGKSVSVKEPISKQPSTFKELESSMEEIRNEATHNYAVAEASPRLYLNKETFIEVKGGYRPKPILELEDEINTISKQTQELSLTEKIKTGKSLTLEDILLVSPSRSVSVSRGIGSRGSSSLSEETVLGMRRARLKTWSAMGGAALTSDIFQSTVGRGVVDSIKNIGNASLFASKDITATINKEAISNAVLFANIPKSDIFNIQDQRQRDVLSLTQDQMQLQEQTQVQKQIQINIQAQIEEQVQTFRTPKITTDRTIVRETDFPPYMPPSFYLPDLSGGEGKKYKPRKRKVTSYIVENPFPTLSDFLGTNDSTLTKKTKSNKSKRGKK